MPGMQKYVCPWSGLTNVAGSATLFFKGDTLVNPSVVGAFFASLVPYMPTGLRIDVPNNGELVQDTDGEVVGTWTLGTSTSSTGAAGGSYPPQAGMQVRWETGQFRRGHHIRGRTFLVPLQVSAFGTGGVIISAACNNMQTAGQTMITNSSGMFGVWHRPLKDYSVKPPVLKQNGEWIPVTGCVAPSKPVTLNSRRD